MAGNQRWQQQLSGLHCTVPGLDCWAGLRSPLGRGVKSDWQVLAAPGLVSRDRDCWTATALDSVKVFQKRVDGIRQIGTNGTKPAIAL